jgi:hypothetical protein
MMMLRRMMVLLTPVRLARIRLHYRRWRTTLPPCGISDLDVFNPCLPEDWEGNGKLRCVTCGLRQRLELQSGV